MDDQLEDALIACLDALDQGEELETVLARYADQATSLRPLLEATHALAHFQPEPAPIAQRLSRQAFLQHASDQKKPWGRRWTFASPQRWLAVGIALLVICISLATTIGIARAALPDETLYPVKRAVEQVQLGLTRDEQEHQQLVDQLKSERRDEIFALLLLHRTAQVQIEGEIDEIQPAGWRVNGIEAHLDQATVIQGVPAIGSKVRVTGQTLDGKLLVSRAEVEPTTEEHETDAPTPRPSPSPQARPMLPAPVQRTPVPETMDETESPEGAPSSEPTATIKTETTDTPVRTSPAAPDQEDHGETHDDSSSSNDS